MTSIWRVFGQRSMISLARRNASSDSPSGTTKPQNDIAKLDARDILQREFPEYFSNTHGTKRISYVEFIDQALDLIKRTGLNRNLEAYKEVLRVFPPGRYHPGNLWDIGMFHAPQQIAALRLFLQMDLNLVKPDKEMERLVISAFSVRSEVWRKCARSIYWSMKARNLDPNPLPEVLPTETHQLAKVALMRMLHDEKSIVTVTNTSSVGDSVDKTWLVFAQSPLQRDIIERLKPETLVHVEESGLSHLNGRFLTYFVLKVYDDEKTIERRKKKPEPDYDFNTLEVQFYGAPLEKKLEQMANVHNVGDGHILATCFSGTSSHDSLLSWIKILQRRNPNLKNLNILFKFERPVSELLDPEAPEEEKRETSGDGRAQ